MDATGKILDFRQFKPKAKEEKRYEEISNFISNYIKLHKPEYMSIEKQYTFGRFGNSILKVSEVV
jgi:Holliday junction resolvasome RuvABC endonuclease subunit